MIDKAEEEIREILKKYSLEMSYEVKFPVYNVLPDEVKLALSVLQKHGMIITFLLKDPVARR